MVELVTEVSLAVIESFLEKQPEKRTEKHKNLALEAIQVLSLKQSQFTESDKILYHNFLELKL